MITKDKVLRRINFRPLLWLFFAGVFSIYATAQLFLGSSWQFAVFMLMFTACLIIFILTFFKKNILLGFQSFFGIKNLKVLCLIILSASLVFSILTAVNYAVYAKRDYANSMHSITATVREISVNDDGQKVLLGDVILDGTKQSFNITASCENEVAVLAVGNKVNLNAYLFANKLVKCGDINTNALKNNVQYYCTIESGVLVSEGKAHPIDYLKDKIKNLYLSSMDENTAGLSFAVTMGDKTLLSSDYYQVFKNSGLAHMLAVSGLHVGFFVAILVMILKFLKVKPKVRFFVIALVLLFYNVICGFAPSVFRASIMSLCLLLGLLIGERNDSLSNLSLAGIIILLLQPLNLFDVGFLLSFSSVFGILFFQNKISGLLCRMHINKIVADPVALTLSATIGTFPWICKFFGEFAPISFLSNLIVLPLFALAYYFLLPSTVFALIFGTGALTVANFLLNIVVTLSTVFANVGMISLFNFNNLCAVVYYSIIFFMSPYFMLKPKSKLICSLAMIVAFCPLLIVCNSPASFNYDSVSLCERANDTALLTTSNNEKILLNVGKSRYGSKNLKSLLKNKKVSEIDILILTNYTSSYNNYLSDIISQNIIKHIVVLGVPLSADKEYIENTCQKINIDFITETHFYITEDIQVSTFVENEKYKAINIRLIDKNYLFVLGAVSYENLNANAIFCQSFNLICTNAITDMRYDMIDSQNFATFSSTIYDEKFSLIDDLWTIRF